ncbi:MAG: M20/M25/M40 family metallo-hydrolase [Hymenobacter sp.]
MHGGVRNNIIPEEVELTGTLRSLNPATRLLLQRRVKEIAENIARSSGATAEVAFRDLAPLTSNNPALVARMLPTLRRVAGEARTVEMKAVTGAEDFGCYQAKVPGLFLYPGGMTPGTDPATTAPHHTAGFRIDESGFGLGVQTWLRLPPTF